MIYVPDLDNYKCYVVQNEQVIRGYKTKPTNNSNVDYRDYYINSSYIYRDGTQSFGQYSTLPVCLSNNSITTDIYYRNDLDKILIIFLIFAIFCIYIPLKIFMRMFRRFL